MNNEIGYEHHFMNYLLYLPYSVHQEQFTLIETLKLMKEYGIINIRNEIELKSFLNKLIKITDKIKKFNCKEIKEIKNQLCSNSDDELIKFIIHGDYKHKNENVEVYLHQRTMKKVKYKKREYDNIHPIDSELIDNIDISKLLNDLDSVSINDRLQREFNKIKNII